MFWRYQEIGFHGTGCRAPELLFVMPEHSTAVDIWAVACIFAEMIIRRELFPGRSVSGQIKIIVTMLGAPSQKVFHFDVFNVYDNSAMES